MKHYVKKFVKIFVIAFFVIAAVVGVAMGGAVLGYWGGIDDLDMESMTLNQNSVIVYTDAKTGKETELQKIDSLENREWADIENIPLDLQNAFIAVEDERFMEHRGYDLPRTIKATFTWLGNKIIGRSGVSLGGSTITQQLIKNVTGETDQTPVRKIREISRAVALEKEMDKTDILEMYLNCIYLSQGCNGVQTAAKTYFGKDVKELSLVECASIAGITQNPSAYDPITNPENNKKRRRTVLGKMYELGYITEGEYNEAVEADLELSAGNSDNSGKAKVTSYYVDQVINDVISDLKKIGYSDALANKIVYSGGVKIYADYNPEIQEIVEKYYSNTKNFYGTGIQSAITVMDVRTGQIVGIAGGIGEKTASLTLNRASQSPRQPGSTIKPIAAYAPALDEGEITPCSVYDDKATSYGGWVPRNYDYSYRGAVDVRTALRKSLNTTPVEIINDMGAKKSYDFLTQNLGVTTLVESREVDGQIYTDIGLSQLALGGLTDGMTTVEMAAAYSTFANGGIYNKPYTYTKVENKDGEIILESERTSTRAMRESTAYIMTQMLKDVVSSGTGVGASVSNASYTAGKTGTTSDNNDRWFVGYTPYYAAAIWYGYDTPKEITVSSNPCIPVFRSIMTSVHSTISDRSRTDERPSSVITVNYCAYTGLRATSSCPAVSYYCGSDNMPSYCSGKHSGLTIPDGVYSDEEDEDEDNDNEENETDKDETKTSSGTSSGSHSGSSNSSSSSSTSSSGSSSASGGSSGSSASTPSLTE